MLSQATTTDVTPQSSCKICGDSALRIFAHTAQCTSCGVLLYYPYPADDETLSRGGDPSKLWADKIEAWYARSSILKHANFADVLEFVFDASQAGTPMNVLDYGGGGGQFALVCKSQFINSTVYFVDIDDDALFDPWKGANRQIRYADFKSDTTQFDYIFLNDLLEHLSDPGEVLQQLSSKLKKDGKIFVDTPRQFWLYPLLYRTSNALFKKLLIGTVSTAHLQIWSEASFRLVVDQARLKIDRYEERSEYTMPPDYYIRNMHITNPLLEWMARVFYLTSPWLVRNKIMCLLSRQDDH